ncbi:hypothetical protein [Kitasatospora sp. GAS204B]|uniref:hypothetical protein n=1 Tax=unclassified Kitasatospora TaxID=2633591 RepID=UPI002473C0C2|nr:hypothetical protein [Kitasatospora sp. GAS204B]MDH6120738.1 hypothetical protein [Kitasatospora sp. GAS204B]
MNTISSNADFRTLFTAYLPARGNKETTLDLTIDALDGWHLQDGAALNLCAGLCAAPAPEPLGAAHAALTAPAVLGFAAA